MTDVVDEEAWLLASPQKPRHRGARVVVASVLAVSLLALAAVRGASPSARPTSRCSSSAPSARTRPARSSPATCAAMPTRARTTWRLRWATTRGRGIAAPSPWGP